MSAELCQAALAIVESDDRTGCALVDGTAITIHLKDATAIADNQRNVRRFQFQDALYLAISNFNSNHAMQPPDILLDRRKREAQYLARTNDAVACQ